MPPGVRTRGAKRAAATPTPLESMEERLMAKLDEVEGRIVKRVEARIDALEWTVQEVESRLDTLDYQESGGAEGLKDVVHTVETEIANARHLICQEMAEGFEGVTNELEKMGPEVSELRTQMSSFKTIERSATKAIDEITARACAAAGAAAVTAAAGAVARTK